MWILRDYCFKWCMTLPRILRRFLWADEEVVAPASGVVELEGSCAGATFPLASLTDVSVGVATARWKGYRKYREEASKSVQYPPLAAD